jgi:transposase
VEAARDAALAAERVVDAPPANDEHGASLLHAEGPGARLLRLKGIGPETASVLAGEAFFRDFRNRREVASYAGLAPTLTFHRLRRRNLLGQLRPVPGRAVASTMSKASRKPATRACAKQWGGACEGSACAARGRQAEGTGLAVAAQPA